MLLAAYKPAFVSSNSFLSKIKRHFHTSKAGYLGTLDPFAKGVLVVGLGHYTRLFPHLIKTPKTYVATLWLGAKSRSLDIEDMQSVEVIPAHQESEIAYALSKLKGEIKYTPPIFSARHINGQRAYKLAREGKDFTLPLSTMYIYDIQLLHYSHPFVKFWVSVSEGAYVRSIGEMIAKNLNENGALCALERISEGEMGIGDSQIFEGNGLCYQVLDPLKYLPYPILESSDLKDKKDAIYNGKKIVLKNTQKGKYIVCFEDFFSIIEVLENGHIQYIVNRI
ncbi:tRNA pseudouridine(55) synthase TruB [Helicobacter sp. MIT 05-5293]|uniref:tRNA pseudouridine(55) synthase TruB n=1 Tax=Helicobacter sp. MIT 05-5293 TaxID=1548149 RepID=UPI00051CDF30|nr:tRNA pseudouridine(55) synthase TruB [Helicobacter sp. MIT 05-5293]TLD81904.1 tRNA pseudouridine(55) synthase TruB [Helicobacter sp. MIT 05-5293]